MPRKMQASIPHPSKHIIPVRKRLRDPYPSFERLPRSIRPARVPRRATRILPALPAPMHERELAMRAPIVHLGHRHKRYAYKPAVVVVLRPCDRHHGAAAIHARRPVHGVLHEMREQDGRAGVCALGAAAVLRAELGVVGERVRGPGVCVRVEG